MVTIKGILWDIDGTLLDSNEAHARAFALALGEEGITTRMERVRRLIGMGADKLLPALADIDPESEQGKRVIARKGELFMQRFFPDVKPFPKAQDLVRALAARGFRSAVATSAKDEEIRPFLKRIGIEAEIDAWASADEVENSKPDPDVVRASLAKIGLPPGEAVMIGDTPYDIEAARAAGVRAIGFLSGGWTERELKSKGATAVFEGAADLLHNLEFSPFVSRNRAG